MEYQEYMKFLRYILSMKKNIILTDNFEYFNYNLIASKPMQNHFNITPTITPILSSESILSNTIKRKKMMLPDTTDNKWIDVWIFADEYSFDINDLENEGNHDNIFPMLLMQFAHILSINKVWINTNA